MDKLYAPWRSDYTASTAHTKNEATSEEECVFCTQFAEKKDAHNFILRRFNQCIIMLNKYPYNAGHLLILPHAHLSRLNQLPQEVRYELIDLTNQSVEILKKVLNPEGFNIGLNLGKAAGAGIPAHLHQHILPRWNGDTNFLPTLAETKAVSFDLHKIYDRLVKEFEALTF